MTALSKEVILAVAKAAQKLAMARLAQTGFPAKDIVTGSPAAPTGPTCGTTSSASRSSSSAPWTSLIYRSSTTLSSEPIAAKDAFLENRYEAEKFMELAFEERLKSENKPPQMPWMAIVDKLVELGWAPPASPHEGVRS